LVMFIFFFFQAEDGIRDRNVTGVQTCALPILVDPISGEYLLDFRNTALDKTFTGRSGAVVAATGYRSQVPDFLTPLGDEVHLDRSEERRVGKEWRSRGATRV